MERLKDYKFAVVDVETTGIFPSMHDRIVEIAAIRVDPNGQIVTHYSTLVNPDRDIGATHIHGISARDVKNAPTFDEIAGDILAVISDAIFVAHNVNFDWRFVQSEMERIGVELPYPPMLCTMKLAYLADPSINSRKLENICRYFEVSCDSTHSAYHDAYATAQIMSKCFKMIGNLSVMSFSDVGVKYPTPVSINWPVISPSGKSYTRQQATNDLAQKQSYVSKLINKLPSAYKQHPEANEYLDLIDRVLEDRKITADESHALLQLSVEIGLHREQAIMVHREYLKDLMMVALDDGIITESEMKDLKEVRNLLSISEPDFNQMLKDTWEDYELGNVKRSEVKENRYNVEGKTICFTGTLTSKIDGELVKRSKAQKIATERGMLVTKNVTQNLDFLVVVDPDSMSGKAKKARKYGTKIIAEPVFWQMMRIQVE